MVYTKNIINRLSRLYLPPWLIAILTMVLILRIPSFFEPFSYGDELIYLTLGEGIRQGVTLYKNLHDNKPPMLYIIAALAGSVFWFKVILAFWNLATIVVFSKLVGVLFKKNEGVQKVATFIFALLTTIPLLEGNIANAEMFMIGPTLLAFYILLAKRQSKKNLLTAGFLFSISTLFKVPAIFDLPAIVIYWLSLGGFSKTNLLKTLKNTFYILLGVIVPVGITLIWYLLKGALGEYVIAAFLQNVGYLSSWRPDDVQLSFLERNSPLLIRTCVLAIGILILIWKRKSLPKKFIFLSGWLLLSLFAVTLSERPYPHYLIQAIPSISVLVALLFVSKSSLQTLVIIPLTLALFVPFYFKFWHYPTLSYYTKFIKFTFGTMSKDDYFRSFGSNTIRNYKISHQVISLTQKGDRILVWGDGTAIYAISRRLPSIKYAADYHINDFSNQNEIFKSIVLSPPEMIIILPDSKEFPKLNSLVNSEYILVTEIDGAQIWKGTSQKIKSILFEY